MTKILNWFQFILVYVIILTLNKYFLQTLKNISLIRIRISLIIWIFLGKPNDIVVIRLEHSKVVIIKVQPWFICLCKKLCLQSLMV